MLFHDKTIAAAINSRFEPTWEKVREVPRVEIDFGNGKKLTRTLNGNVATYFVTPEGGVFDIVPGIVSPAEYATRLDRALGQFNQLSGAGPTVGRTVVAHYHRVMSELLPKGNPVVLAEGLRLGPGPDMRKFIVEGPLKKAFGSRNVERRVGHMLMAAAKVDAGQKGHDLDTETAYNRKNRYPKVHALLQRRALASPATLTKIVYKTILDVDLDDPYLGLAPYVLGGEPGRH